MSKISIKKIGITKLETDAVVNAANTGLWEGEGVCGYIFRDAGSAEMTEACNKYGHCDEGSAVITPGFKLPAKYVIHAVGPKWSGGKNNEPKLLYSAYKQSLILAKENDLHSIGFPLISAGIFGYPVDKAWRKAIQACNDFINSNPDYEIDIIFAVLDDMILKTGENTLKDIVGVQSEDESDVKKDTEQDLQEAYKWCLEYSQVFRIFYEDPELRKRLQSYSVYSKSEGHPAIYHMLHECMEEAYKSNVVIVNYSQIIEESRIADRDVAYPTEESVESLTINQILALIAWHFRRDHFSEGSWICDSVANGYMCVLVNEFIKKYDK